MAGVSQRRTVVGAAVLRDGRVLAARRTAPAAAAGRWELPGGKVEPGETREAALVREIREELRCDVEVRGWLRGAVPVGEDHELAVAVAVLLGGEPAPVEHDRVRWLGPDELDAVDWLEPDQPFLPGLRRRMTAPDDGSVRAIFFDEEHAAAAVARLRRDGYDARAERERLAGEDDDEDHPWAVVSDAPAIALELLVDEYDGWLDTDDDPAPSPAPPLDLPDGPRRQHRPG